MQLNDFRINCKNRLVTFKQTLLQIEFKNISKSWCSIVKNGEFRSLIVNNACSSHHHLKSCFSTLTHWSRSVFGLARTIILTLNLTSNSEFAKFEPRAYDAFRIILLFVSQFDWIHRKGNFQLLIDKLKILGIPSSLKLENGKIIEQRTILAK